MNKGVRIVKLIAIGTAAVALFGFVFMLVWNLLIPEIFNGNPISFWQALGLLLLAKMIFMPLGKSHGSHRWKPYWKERWSAMSDEQKAIFRQRMSEKCGWGSKPVEKTPDQP